MPKIMPISVLQDANEISETCHQTNEPIFITKNGYDDMVIMSVTAYERDFALVDVYRKLLVAERQINNGEVLDAQPVFERLREKYGY